MVEQIDGFEKIEKQNGDQKFEKQACNQNSKVYEETTIAKEDTNCGFGCLSPKWLQIFASKKVFVLVYALAGMQQFVVSSYYIGTMSTMEKNFKMSSQQSGIISGAWDVGTLVANIGVTYVAAKGHRTRWVALGMLIMGITSFLRTLPYILFGPGENIKMYTKEYGYLMGNISGSGNSTGLKRLSTNVNCGVENENTSSITFYILVIGQAVMGIGSAVYWTCGATYLDDNARKNVVPLLLAIVQVIRLFGPTVGFLLSSYALNFYVDPKLTPVITTDDPRWVGAWWFGWYPIGIACLVLTVCLMLFPRSLPRAAERRKSTNTPSPQCKSLSVSDFVKSMRRILSNKIVVYNSFSSVFYALGLMAHWTFMPKYMESQFRLSASKSNLLTGTIGIICNALGILIAGLVISKFKPSPRLLAAWNVLVEFLQVIGYASYTFMSCPEQQYYGHWDSDHKWNLTETCNAQFKCGNDIQFAPVCDTTTGVAFYSPCHAGCNVSSIVNGTWAYSGCTCAPNSGKLLDGLCPADCSFNIILFMTVMGFLSFATATGRSSNTLLQFRCVDEEDKSLSIGVTETLLSLLAFIPAPILYGVIMDSTCIVWGDSCGARGNCWIYDGFKLRAAFNITAAAFLLIGTFIDCFVWYHSKGLKIYDEDFLNDKKLKKKTTKTPIVRQDIIVEKKEIARPLIDELKNEENR